VSEGGRVVVVTGLGGMGKALAKRLGSGSTVVLADANADTLKAAADQMRADGHRVIEHPTDVSDKTSVAALADTASGLGRVEVLVHTAGLSPVQASAEAILRVDLLGSALVLDAFASAIAEGGSGVVIASMAGSLQPIDPDLEHRLATTPTADLLGLPELTRAVAGDSATAYGLAKRVNQLRVRAASVIWGRRRARVNSISPGVISTPMGVAELQGPYGEIMRTMVDGSATGRLGTPEDIAGAVEFLTGPHSTFITGTDLLVDGGVVAALLTGSPRDPESGGHAD
jgi:NAD(P)-dependent dehydrogenase (short-subunit alcohol dehydrogenase family)